MKRILSPFFFCSFFLLSGCGEVSEVITSYKKNYEIIGVEKERLLENMSDTIYESIERDQSEAKEVILDVIDKHGNVLTLPEGRYEISGGYSGTIEIHDAEGKLLLTEIIAPSPLGVESVTVDLNGSHILHVSGFNGVTITPVATERSTQLTTGIWEVGKDIEAGNYSVTGNVLGNLFIFEKGKEPQVYEIINGEPATEIDVQLQTGQKLKLSGLVMAQFHHKD